MENMFKGCASLTSLNLNNFNTKNVQGMANMLKNCESLKTLYIDNFIYDNCLHLEKIFYNCFSLENVNLTICKILNLNNYLNVLRKNYIFNKLIKFF